MSHFVLSEGFCISFHLYLGCSSLWHCHVSSSQSLWLEGHFLKRFALATYLNNIPLSPFCHLCSWVFLFYSQLVSLSEIILKKIAVSLTPLSHLHWPMIMVGIC